MADLETPTVKSLTQRLAERPAARKSALLKKASTELDIPISNSDVETGAISRQVLERLAGSKTVDLRTGRRIR